MIIPTGFAQANYRFTGSAVALGAEVTMGYIVTGWGGSASEAAVELAGLWNSSNMDNLHAPNVILSEVEVKFGPNATGESGLWSGAIPGTASGVADSPNTSLLVKKITGAGGRAGRGRMFIPGAPAEKISEAGTLDVTWAGLMDGVLSGWYEDQGLAALLPYLLHSEGSPISAPTLITSFTLDRKVATQRRRLRS